MDIAPDKSDKPSLEPKADIPAGYADKQLYEAQQKVKARTPIFIGITIALLAIGITVIISGIAFLLTLP